MRALLTVAWLVAAVFLTWHAAAFKAPAIQEDILARSTEAVKAVNADAEVFASGRFVIVRGPVRDEATRMATLAAARDVWGARGPLDDMTLSGEKAEAIVLAEKSADGSLRLSGSLPSEDARMAVEKAAKAAFAGAIDNRLATADTGALTVPNLEDAFRALAALDSGTILVNAQRVLVSGSTSDPAKAAMLRTGAAAKPWQLFLDAPAPARFAASKLPDGTILASGDVASDAVRASLIEALMDGDENRHFVDRMAVSPGGISDEWTARAMTGAKALADLDWGSVSLDGAKSYLTGMAGPNEIGRISDNLGDSFTAELTPRPADEMRGRVSTIERELRMAKSRVLDLSAAAAKHLADLNAAEAQVDELRRAGQSNKVDAESAKQRISALEAAAAKSRDDLDFANARIAGLTEMLSLRPLDLPLPADALPAPSQSSLEPPATQPSVETQQPETTGATSPIEPQDMEAAALPAQEPPPMAAPEPPPDAPVETAALPPVQDAERVATACNAAIGSVLSSAAISFESKSAQITREGNDVLDRLMAEAAPCIGNPALKVTIGGHTDSRGQDRDNLRLSKERADSVKESLIVRSVPPEAITAIGYGETMPVADNDTDDGRAANRRITIDWSLR